MPDTPTPVLDAFRQKRSFWLVSHARPDGDALGSLLALRALLTAAGRRAEVLLRDPLPYPYGFLPGAECVRVTPAAPGGLPAPEALVMLECASFARSHITGLEGYFTISLDHHPSARSFANVNWIDQSACAVSEMIYRLARAMAWPVSAAVATCLYTGVVADTGGFIFANTSARTLELGAELARLGAPPHGIAAQMYLAYPEAKMRVLGAALSHLQVAPPLAWMWVEAAELEGLGAGWEDAEGLVNYALGVRGVELAAFFRPAGPADGPGRQRVSLRSAGAVDVCAIAQEFGGGGHRQASGFSLPGAAAGVRDRVLERLRQALQSALAPPRAAGLRGS
ncbi:MAG: DHH family phosphoesterase [Terriglobales bacterium]